MNPAEFGLWLKCNELFALASSELAFPPTPLDLRFFSPVAPLSAVDRPRGLPFPVRFSPLPLSSPGLKDIDLSFEPSTAAGATGSGPPSLGGDPELPNILFSRPPWEEKLLRLFPATLLAWWFVSREET